MVLFFLFILLLTSLVSIVSIPIANLFLKRLKSFRKSAIITELALMLVLAAYLFWEAINLALTSLVFLVIGIVFVNRLTGIFPSRHSVKLTNIEHFGRLLMLAISVHEFTEGIGFGSSFAMGQTAGLVTAFLISLQNFFEGSVIAMPFLLEKRFKHALKAVSLTQIAFAIGSIGTYLVLIALGSFYFPYGLAFSSGGLVYIAVEEFYHLRKKKEI